MQHDSDDELKNYKFGGFIDYCDLGNNHTVHYAKITDFNGLIVLVPFSDPEKKLIQLIESYVLVTECKQYFKGKKQLLGLRNKNSNVGYLVHRVQIKDIRIQLQKQQICVTNGEDFQEDELCVISHSMDLYEPATYKADAKGKKMTVQVRALENIFKISILDTDPIGRLKQLIAAKIKQKTGSCLQWQQIRILNLGNAVRNGEMIKDSNLNCKEIINVFEQKIVKQTEEIFYLNLKTINDKSWKIEVEATEKIEQIVKFVEIDKKMKRDQFKITYSGKKLSLSKRISDYGIKSGSTLNVMPNINKNIKVDSSDSIIIIKICANQTMEMFYNDIKALTIAEFFRHYVETSKPFWCMYYQNKIYYPYQKFAVLEPFIQNGITIQVLKNEKYFFVRKLKENPCFPKQKFVLNKKSSEKVVKTSGTIKQRVIQKVSEKTFRDQDHVQYLKQQFYSPIQYYTCPQFYKQINLFLRGLNVNSSDKYVQKPEFQFINSLIQNLKKIPPYIGLVHRGIDKFKFSMHHDFGDLICWRSFTSTSMQQKQARKFVSKDGCIVHINSLNGKPVDAFSIYQYEKQVMFLPFTYFYIDRIQVNQDVEQVWITQVPSPATFNKNIIIWVDDIPKNNTKAIAKMNKYPIEILPLYSTKIANKWMEQFNQFLEWSNLRLKVISDMVRYEINPKTGEKVVNYQAGIDLLESFNNKHGYTTKILVFCGDPKRGMQSIEKKNIKDKIWSVTNSEKILLQYCDFDRVTVLSLSEKSVQ